MTKFEINQGEDFLRLITIKNDAGVPINLTGHQFRGQGRKKYSDTGTPPISFSFVIDADQTANPGQVHMILSAANTAAILISATTVYLYDVEMVDADNKVTRILEGTLVLRPEVTK